MNSQVNTDALDAFTPSKSTPPKSTPRTLVAYRWMIFYRFSLATVGGYLLAALVAMVTAQLFAEQRANAVMSATLLAFCVHTAAFIWVFMVHKTLKATLGIIIPMVILFVIYQLLGT